VSGTIRKTPSAVQVVKRRWTTARIEPLPVHNAETGQRFSTLAHWRVKLPRRERSRIPSQPVNDWAAACRRGCVRRGCRGCVRSSAGDNDPLTVLPSPCEQRLSDVLDLSRVAILLVAAALGRLVRHVPSAVELFVELHVLRRMVVLCCGR
jgi:hypothetical protein